MLLPEILTSRVLGDAQGWLQGCFPCSSSLQAQSQGIAMGTSHFWGGICQVQVGHCWNGLGCTLAASEVRAEDLAPHTCPRALEIFFNGLKSAFTSVPRTQAPRGCVCSLNILNPEPAEPPSPPEDSHFPRLQGSS